MQKLLSQKYQATGATPIGEAGSLGERYGDLINLSIGDPDIPTPETVLEKAFQDGWEGHTKYTHPRGYRELRDEIRAFYREDYGVELTDEQVFVSASGLTALYLALMVLLDPGDEVLLPDPCFGCYPDQVRAAGGRPVFVPTYAEEGFALDVGRLEALATPRTKAVLISTPNNPTGACLTPESLRELAEFCRRRDLLVLADDIYTNFCYREPFRPILSLPGMAERTVTINSFSKNFIMTGFRVGNLIAPPEVVAAVQRLNEYVVYSAPSVSQRAALWALRERRSIEPPIHRLFQERMTYAARRMNAIPGMSVGAPQGSIYLFPSIRETGLTSAQAARLLLEKAHVLTLPGDSFGACGEGHLRIACTVDDSVMGEAMDRIGRLPEFS